MRIFSTFLVFQGGQVSPLAPPADAHGSGHFLGNNSNWQLKNTRQEWVNNFIHKLQHIIKILTKAIKLSENMFTNLQKLTGFLAVTRTARTYVKILFEYYVFN